MKQVTVSTKYQVVIPLEVRQRCHIEPGQKLQVFVFDNRIELVPTQNVKTMRGFLKGINTRVPREHDRL